MKHLIRPILVAAALAAAAPVSAQGPLRTNEADIAEAALASTLDMKDPMAVFAFVLGRLPDEVRVLPTENYYYFSFTNNGLPYTGNIRLSAKDRDQGKLHFSYGEQPSDWRTQFDVQQAVLDASRGVTLEKVGDLVYRVSHGGKAVTFRLNDLSQVKPPANLLREAEQYIGPIFDESGIRFFLVFNKQLGVFHYILDESEKVPDEFTPAQAAEKVIVGKRTGFAFYREEGRNVLVGVNERNSQLNTPFDGPFDQLPENFIDGDTLRDAILVAEPSLKDKIDRLGNLADREDRYLIHPYMLYRRQSDLAVFQRCMTNPRVPAAIHPRCFVIGDDEAQKRNPLPLALKRREAR